jgi:hypothetical protein
MYPPSGWNDPKWSCSGKEGRRCRDAANTQSSRQLGGLASHNAIWTCVRPAGRARAWGLGHGAWDQAASKQYDSGVTSDFGRKGETKGHQADLAEAQPLVFPCPARRDAATVTETETPGHARSMTTSARAVLQPTNQAARARGSVGWQASFHAADADADV